MNPWLKAYLAVPFRVIGTVLVAIMETYKKNRTWIEARLSQKHTARSLQGVVVVTFAVWMVIWALNNL